MRQLNKFKKKEDMSLVEYQEYIRTLRDQYLNTLATPGNAKYTLYIVTGITVGLLGFLVFR